jgi:hypothetical protein
MVHQVFHKELRKRIALANQKYPAQIREATWNAIGDVLQELHN